MNKSSLTSNLGFTLIELVVVIVILGVLSVTALPKFINIKSDANVVVINTAIGVMKSAVSLFKVKVIASGTQFLTVTEFAGVKGSHYQPWAATATATGFRLIIHHLLKYLKLRV
ncbi:MAG: MSHA pilin protein MshA [Alteromonadaceae bacterium]|jgi:MSHA pilin protein MshA